MKTLLTSNVGCCTAWSNFVKKLRCRQIVRGEPEESKPFVLCMYVCMFQVTLANQQCLYIYVYVCFCFFVCMYVRVHVCIFESGPQFAHVYMYACTFVCMYVCIYVCMYVQNQPEKLAEFVFVFVIYICLCACMFMGMNVCMCVLYVCKAHACMYLCIYACCNRLRNEKTA